MRLWIPVMKNRQMDFIPVTNCQPTIHPAIYFHESDGNRIVVDLKIPYRYQGNLSLRPFPDSRQLLDLYRQFEKLETCCCLYHCFANYAAWGWKKISLDEESRFVMIRFSSYETAILPKWFFMEFRHDTIPRARQT